MLTSGVAAPRPIYLAKTLIYLQAHPLSARLPYARTGDIGLLTLQNDSNNNNRLANDGSDDADGDDADDDDGDNMLALAIGTVSIETMPTVV